MLYFVLLLGAQHKTHFKSACNSVSFLQPVVPPAVIDSFYPLLVERILDSLLGGGDDADEAVAPELIAAIGVVDSDFDDTDDHTGASDGDSPPDAKRRKISGGGSGGSGGGGGRVGSGSGGGDPFVAYAELHLCREIFLFFIVTRASAGDVDSVVVLLPVVRRLRLHLLAAHADFFASLATHAVAPGGDAAAAAAASTAASGDASIDKTKAPPLPPPLLANAAARTAVIDDFFLPLSATLIDAHVQCLSLLCAAAATLSVEYRRACGKRLAEQTPAYAHAPTGAQQATLRRMQAAFARSIA
jgi:hypothetical protein